MEVIDVVIMDDADASGSEADLDKLHRKRDGQQTMEARRRWQNWNERARAPETGVATQSCRRRWAQHVSCATGLSGAGPA